MSIGRKSRSQVSKNRQQVFTRDHMCCVVQGSLWARLEPCRGQLTVQHRVGRGMGGSAKYDAPEYMVAMCAHHNQLQTSSAEFAKACERLGWSVRRSVADLYAVTGIPVFYGCEGWFLLSTDFRRVLISNEEAEDYMALLYGKSD